MNSYVDMMMRRLGLMNRDVHPAVGRTRLDEQLGRCNEGMYGFDEQMWRFDDEVYILDEQVCPPCSWQYCT